MNNYKEAEKVIKYLAITLIPGVLTYYVLKFCYQNIIKRGLEKLVEDE